MRGWIVLLFLIPSCLLAQKVSDVEWAQMAYEKGQIPSDNFYTILYLMGEINRRIGKVEEANIVFDELISLTENREDQVDIRNLAIQQKTNPKEIL